MNLNWAIALCCATGAVASDLYGRRISNRWLAVCGVAALAAQAAQGAYLSALLGGLIGGLALIVPFWLGGMGAGDVKLLAVVGVALGVAGAVTVSLCTAIAGGVLAVLVRYDVGRSRAWLGTPWRAQTGARRAVRLATQADVLGLASAAHTVQTVGPSVPTQLDGRTGAAPTVAESTAALPIVAEPTAAPPSALPAGAPATLTVTLPYAAAVWLGLGGALVMRLAVGA